MTYSAIGILAAIILLIINRDVIWTDSSQKLIRTQKTYRYFLFGVLSYYITDALWGILDALHLTAALFVDTSVYFCTMALAVVLWTRYVIAYLESEGKFSTFLYYVGIIFFLFEIVAVFVNFFKPVLFWFDETGAYYAGPVRYVTLVVQILLFLLAVIYTMHVSSRSEGTVRNRHRAIGFFGVAMIILIIFQVFYPLLPFYAMGYMLGTCLLHSFVVEDEKEERRRELDNALQEAEKANRAKTVFLNNMSHDLRTPMNAIIGFTALASSSLDDKELTEDYLKKIAVSSQHMLSLINDVLDMSRIESGNMTLEESEVHLPQLIEELDAVIQPQITAKQLDFSVDLENIVHEDIVTDKLRLRQVFINILSNAIKFTPDGGSINICIIEKPSAGDDHMTTFEIRITDTGIGMSEEFQETIFDAFTREKTSTVSRIQGTGLGMSITKNIIDMMGGNISVSSKVGEGTEFVIEIPLRIADGSQDPDKPQMLSETDFAGKHILLAEDNEMNQIIAVHMLQEHGFTLDVASDGRQAVEMMEAAPAGTYDVILMDIQMPDMDGYEAAKRIRNLEDRQKASIPIIAVTANAFEEDRKLAIEAGMDDHLAKPYVVPDMLKTIEKLLK